jgi:hypothetical protein
MVSKRDLYNSRLSAHIVALLFALSLIVGLVCTSSGVLAQTASTGGLCPQGRWCRDHPARAKLASGDWSSGADPLTEKAPNVDISFRNLVMPQAVLPTAMTSDLSGRLWWAA